MDQTETASNIGLETNTNTNTNTNTRQQQHQFSLDFSEIDYPYSLERLGDLEHIREGYINNDKYYLKREIIRIFSQYYKYDQSINSYRFIINANLFYGITDLFLKNPECYQEGLWRERKVIEFLEKYNYRIPYFMIKANIRSHKYNQSVPEIYRTRTEIMSELIHEEILREYGYEYYEEHSHAHPHTYTRSSSNDNKLYITISLATIFDKFREKYNIHKEEDNENKDLFKKVFELFTTNQSHLDLWKILSSIELSFTPLKI
jgi:hypothetical protein